MTIQFRDNLLRCLSFLALIIFASSVFFIWSQGFSGLKTIATNNNLSNSYFVVSIIKIISVSLFGLILLWLIMLRKLSNNSLELLFFAIWLFCNCLEILCLDASLIFIHGYGSSYFLILSRVILFFRYSSLLFLFVGSLFCNGLSSDMAFSLTLAAFLLSLFFATMLPLSSSFPSWDFIPERGMTFVTDIFIIIVSALTVINYLISWRANRDKAYLYCAFLLTILFVISFVITKHLSLWFIIPCVVVFPIASILYIKIMHDYYLWR